jgi:hypothetical protein
MNHHNIKQYLKECFKQDFILEEQMYTDRFEDTDFYENPIICYDTTDFFMEYIQSICENVNFYRYCRLLRRTDSSNFHEIVREIECNEVNYNERDLKDKNYVYNWFFRNRVQFFLSKQFDFLLNIVREVHEETDANNKN